MAHTFPDAEVLCLWNDAPERFPASRVTESWLAKTPLRRSKIAAVPFMPAIWSGVDVDDQDFVLVSSHLFAHHVGGRRASSRKYVYVHTPARYIWTPELDARGSSVLARIGSPLLRQIDAAQARSGASMAANSNFVRDRIRDYWDRDATVIYPPVGVERIQAVRDWRSLLSPDEELLFATLPTQFLLGASRFVSYKRLELVILAGELSDVPVVLAGSGPSRTRLEEIAAAAKVPVFFVDRPSDQLLYSLYQAALALVFPAVEDFGIMPVEAMSVGTPVVVSEAGGARESVTALSGGVVAESLSADGLKRAVELAVGMQMDTAQALAPKLFGEERFSLRLREWVR
jgi:glycosyltransferase involved in cell wall biosynthesis